MEGAKVIPEETTPEIHDDNNIPKAVVQSSRAQAEKVCVINDYNCAGLWQAKPSVYKHMHAHTHFIVYMLHCKPILLILNLVVNDLSSNNDYDSL